jgi:DNA-directed RNA polymerase subunit E'/Rpb7
VFLSAVAIVGYCLPVTDVMDSQEGRIVAHKDKRMTSEVRTLMYKLVRGNSSYRQDLRA